MDNSCPFCVEFVDLDKSEFRQIFPTNTLSDRYIKSTPNFTSLVSLGAIRAGYLLILPKFHYTAFSLLDKNLAIEAHNLKNILVRVVEEIFLPPIIFEHGSIGNDSSTGNCIDHAHLHILPTKVNLFPRLQKNFPYISIKHLTDLIDIKLQKQPYIYYEHAGQGYAFLVNQNLPSQYMRRLVLEEEGNPDEWDWEVFLGKNNIIETVNKLKKMNL